MRGLLAAFSSKRLDLKINVTPGFYTRIIERPGLWLGKAEVDALLSDLRTIAEQTVSAGELDYGVFSGDPEVLKRTIITIVYRKADGLPVAFNAMPVIQVSLSDKPIEVLHLGLVMIHPEVRSQGLSWVLYGLTCFLLFLRNQLRPLWISNVTQVPAVAGMVTETFSNVFPSPKSGSRRTLKQQLIATQIMEGHRHVFGVGDVAGFDIDRFVITNAYTGGSDNLKKSFDEAPKHRNADYNDFCEAQLNYQRGDDLLQIGQLDVGAARRYLMESVPRNALAHLAVAGSLVFLQRLILPVLYWADGKRQWGILRARDND